jgi:hypothetical protein
MRRALGICVIASALVIGGRAARAQPADPVDDAAADPTFGPGAPDDAGPADDAGGPDDAGAGVGLADDAGGADDAPLAPGDPFADAGAPADGGAILDAGVPPVDALPTPDIDPILFGQPEVSAVASPTSVRLGEPITLVVTAVYITGVNVNLPDPLVLGDAFEVGRREVTDKQRSDGRHIREWQIRVLPWELGDLMVPPIQVTFTAGGKAAAVETRALPIRVVGALGDVDDPRLLRGMSPPISLWSRSWFWALIAGGTLLAIVALVLWLRARRRRRRAVAPVAAAAPIAAVRPRRRLDALANATLAKLDELERSGRLDSDRKAAYAELIDLMRDYLGARFGFAHDKLTSAELRAAVAARSDAISDAAVAGWLAGCDLVRYAGRDGSSALAHATLEDSRGLVLTTTPGGRAPIAEVADA